MAHEIQTIHRRYHRGNHPCSAGSAGKPWVARGGGPVLTRKLWADFLLSVLALIA